MSTNTPPRKYGYTLPSLGGIGMGKRTLADLFWDTCSVWRKAAGSWELDKPFTEGFWYTRPIDVGPEHELVGEDEYIKGQFECTEDGVHWNGWLIGTPDTVKNLIHNKPILAIRRRKVVKDEWPKYWEGSDFVRRALSPKDTGQFFTSKGWRNYAACEPLITWIDKITGADIKSCTAQRAFELTGDKEILKKGGDEKCATLDSQSSKKSGNVASPAPEVTKGASSDWKIVLDALVNAQQELLKNVGRFTWLDTPIHIAEQNSKASSPPQWIPVSERLPKEAVFVPVMVKGWSRITVAALKYGGGWSYCEEDKHPKSITHWMELPQSSPPQLKTREQEDEEWIMRNSKNLEQSQAMAKALAYARGEKGEK